MDEIIKDEVIELKPVESVATGISGKALALLGAGAAALVGGIVFVKKVVVPAIKERKAQKEAEAQNHDFAVMEFNEDESEEN